MIHTIGLQVVTPFIVGFNLIGTGSSIVITAPGDSGTSTVTATPTNGFTGTVDFHMCCDGESGGSGRNANMLAGTRGRAPLRGLPQ